jgi:hypothetical protein
VSGHWFYSVDGRRQVGPVTKAELEGLLARGELDATSLVWTDAMADWRPATEVAALDWTRPATPPPLPAAPSPGVAAHTQTTVVLERVEIRPRSHRNALLLVGCALFLGAGALAMIQWPESETDPWWGGGILAFAVLCLYGAGRMWRRKTSMVLAPDHLEQVTLYGSAAVPWSDVEKVGSLSYLGQKIIGVRLRSYDAYLANLSPELAGTLTKAMPLVRVAATGVSMLPGSQFLTLWSRLDGVSDPGDALKGFGKVGDLAGLLMASRKMLGYDLTFGWADFDRPVDALVRLLEQYRLAAEVADTARTRPGAAHGGGCESLANAPRPGTV